MTGNDSLSPLIAFYGDDFTGSTDAMEVLEMAGLSTTLFLDPPTKEQLAKVPPGQGIGLAGISRSLPTEAMDAELRPKFEFLKSLRPRLMHYKVCSTFDSSPKIGSIGRAIDIGFEIFNPDWSPLMIGAPRLNRFVAFGNLFARVDSTPYRLDRHPTMSRHPVTPMTESDIRELLAQQTSKAVGLIDTLTLSDAEAMAQLDLQAMTAETPLILFDIMREEELAIIGKLIWKHAGEAVTFSASSSGLEYALAAHWKETGFITRAEPFQSAGPAERMVVMSGSAAPITQGQIQHARKQGWGLLRLPAPDLIHPEKQSATEQQVLEQSLDLLESHDRVILYSTEGPRDSILEETRAVARNHGIASPGQLLGHIQGKLLKHLLNETGIRRVCVAGGDTSGYCAKALGIFGLRVQSPIDPGGPLCRAYAEGPFDGLEISLKGGQVGRPDYFECILNGDTNSRN